MSRASLGNPRLSNYANTSYNASENTYETNDSFSIADKQESSFLHPLEHDDEHPSEGSNEPNMCPYGCCKRAELRDHLFTKGLLEGKYSDVTIEAFGTEYKLHRLFLDKSGYFRSLFSWNETDRDDEESMEIAKALYTVTFDDEYISKESFELALSRLYGTPNYAMELTIPHNMIAVSSYLDIDEVICTNTERIIQDMSMSNVSKYLKFATTNHYGLASARIIDSAKGILCSSGWESGAANWDEIPVDVIADVVGEDCFFVPNEWDRCMFIIKLIERRTHESIDMSDDLSLHSTSSTIYDSDVNILRKALREKVYYCHLSAEQLEQLSDFNDINGIAYIDSNILHEALWQSTSLQRTIMKSLDVPNLGLAISSDNEAVGKKKNWYRVPVRDETICGSPSTLKKLMSEHQYALANTGSSSSVNEGEYKTSGDSENAHAAESKIYSWTKLPPFRFSIAFANASDLSTEKRVYAKTLWYAGSYWNLYLQKVKVKQKKGFQMGVYLHRASAPSSSSRNGLANPDVFVDNINYSDPPIHYREKSSAETSIRSVDQQNTLRSGNDEKEILDDDTLLSYLEGLDLSDISNREISTGYAAPATKLAQTLNDSIFTPMVLHPLFNSNQQNQRSFLSYDDTRSKILVYFVISTPSRRAKSTITSFVSAPDTFNKSQSWGWKSNSMCVFNEDGTFPKDHEKHLKFMVVLGNI